MSEAVNTDIGNPETVAKAKVNAKAKAMTRREDVAAVLSTSAGRRFVWDLLGRCGIFALSYARGDTHETAFNEGKRQIGNPLFAEIQSEHPEAYAQMAAESKEPA